MQIIETLVALVFAALFLAIYVGSAAWAVGDAQKRGYGGGLIVLLFYFLGPLSAVIWLAVRPSKSLIEHSPQDYANAEDALAAASRALAGARQLYSGKHRSNSPQTSPHVIA